VKRYIELQRVRFSDLATSSVIAKST